MESIIQWYPGHIAKLERELKSHLKQLDVVIEILDARIPHATQHTSLSQNIRQQKPVLLLLNKADLADEQWTKRWIDYFKDHYTAVLSCTSLTAKANAQIIQTITRLGEPTMLRQESKGLKRRPIRVGIVGMPNVGKSSLLNMLVGRKKAQTGHRAGVTRTTQWVRIHPQVELIDTPGIIPAKLDSPERGQLLASVYSVGDAAFDEEAIIPFFLEKVNQLYPGLLHQAFDLPSADDPSVESIAHRRGYLMPGGNIDPKRAAQAILKDYRHGKLGRITLEHPPTQEK